VPPEKVRGFVVVKNTVWALLIHFLSRVSGFVALLVVSLTARSRASFERPVSRFSVPMNRIPSPAFFFPALLPRHVFVSIFFPFERGYLLTLCDRFWFGPPPTLCFALGWESDGAFFFVFRWGRFFHCPWPLLQKDLRVEAQFSFP